MSVVEDLTGITSKRDAVQAESDAIKNAPIEERQRLIDEQERARMLERNQRGTGIKPISMGAASLMSPTPATMLTAPQNPVNPSPTPVNKWVNQRVQRMNTPRIPQPAKTLLGQ